MILIHGTTCDRAKRLLLHPPLSGFQEPGAQFAEDSFSMYIDGGPYHFGTPEEYARSKADLYPDENGPALLRVDVPEEIVRLAENQWFPIKHGLVQFDPGAGIEELSHGWADLRKWIQEL